MILTVTPSPLLLRTATLPGQIIVGETNLLHDVAAQPGGSGVAIGRVLFAAGVDVKALFPAPEISQYLRLVRLLGMPHDFLPVPGPVQTVFSLDDAAGNRTHFTEQPMPLDATQLAMFRDMIVTLAEKSEWVVLAGPLPDIAPAAWYVEVTRALNLYHPSVKVAISTSGQALRATTRQLAATQPDLLVLRPEEAAETEAGLVASAQSYVAHGVNTVLVVPSRDRALSVTASEPPTTAVFTGQPGKQSIDWVDAAVAGFLLGVDGCAASKSLRSAVAYANAAGSEFNALVPAPDTVNEMQVEVH